MLRRLSSVLVVLVLAGVAASIVQPDRAAAQTVTPYESLRAGNATYLDDFYRKILWDTERAEAWNASVSNASNSNKNALYRQVVAGRMNARMLPRFATFATRASLAGLAAYMGYRIYQQWTGGSQEVDLWVSSPNLGTDALFNPCAAPPGVNCPPDMPWATATTALNGSGCTNSGTGLAFLGGTKCEVGAAWVLAFSTGNGNGGCATALSGVPAPCFELHLQPLGWNAIADARVVVNGCASTSSILKYTSCWWSWRAADATGGMGYFYPNSSQVGWNSQWPQQLAFAVEQTLDKVVAEVPGAVVFIPATNGSGNRVKVVISPENLQTGTVVLDGGTNPGTPTETYNYALPSPYTGPDSVGAGTDTQSALEAFDSDCGQAFVNWVLDPVTYSFNADSCGGWTEVTTFPLLQPLINETYPAYIGRLQAVGLLGSATSVEATEAQTVPEMGPLGVARVIIGTNVYNPLAWPAIAPYWNVSTNVTVRYNPATVEEAPGGGTTPGQTAGGVGVPVPPAGPLGDWCEACPPVDFSPLTDAPLGESFPFGVVPWLGDYIGSLMTAPEAPVFSFNFDGFQAGTFGPYNLGQYEVDLAVMDAYMSIIRTILSWCIWVGGVWWFGSRLLGFRETGDPGAAVDEAWS